MKIWKDIPWYEWLYQCNVIGNIKSLYLNKILSNKPNPRGYIQVWLYKNGKSKNYKIHRLVMITFKWKSKLQVNHINWIKTDNRLENLEYCTAKENTKHAREILWINQSPKWIFHYKSRWIAQLDKNRMRINEWETIKEASDKLNISNWNISLTCSWKRKTAGGFIWEYL